MVLSPHSHCIPRNKFTWVVQRARLASLKWSLATSKSVNSSLPSKSTPPSRSLFSHSVTDQPESFPSRIKFHNDSTITDLPSTAPGTKWHSQWLPTCPGWLESEHEEGFLILGSPYVVVLPPAWSLPHSTPSDSCLVPDFLSSGPLPVTMMPPLAISPYHSQEMSLQPPRYSSSSARCHSVLPSLASSFAILLAAELPPAPRP